ncbi:MAG: universal stress protein [Myxococcales bacterium]
MLEWHRILCPVDFSEPSRRAMQVAAQLAKEHGAELLLLHVYQAPGVSFPEATFLAGDEVLQQLVDMVLKSLTEWKAEAMKAGAADVSTHTAMGTPYAEILRFAEKLDCDLVVMGTHGRTALARVFIGSVAEKVVRHAPCPVLTVRPNRERTVEAEAPVH